MYYAHCKCLTVCRNYSQIHEYQPDINLHVSHRYVHWVKLQKLEMDAASKVFVKPLKPLVHVSVKNRLCMVWNP